MPTDEEGHEPKPKEPKDQKRREQVLVGAALAGVVLTVLLVRRSSANAAAAMPVGAPVAASGGGTGGGSNTGDLGALQGQLSSWQASDTQAFASIQSQIHGIATDVSMLQVHTSNGSSSSPTSISTPTPTTVGLYTLQDVQDLFAQHGFSSVPPDTGETADQRAARILRQLNSGTRTPSQVSTSIGALPGAR